MLKNYNLQPCLIVNYKEVTLGFEIKKESYAGSIKEITIGKGAKAITVGGEACYPFYQFEGKMPNKPRIAMEVWDIEPEDWPAAALAPFKDVVSDPAAWAKKCISEYGAEMIVLQLKSTDPNDKDASPAAAAATVKKVLAAIDVPLIVWGCGNPAKDEEVLKVVSQECEGSNLTLGPVEDKNHKGIGASAMGYGHTVISSSPIDVNLAKQVNILLENLGMPMNRVIVDPTTGGLGYGLEYTYSVMERLRMAALAQGDDKLQFPIINNLGNEIWKCKESKLTVEDAPLLGDPEKRGILLEAVGAVSYLISGSNILIMRHPESIKMVKAFIDLISVGGSAMSIAPIAKRLDDVNIDFAKLSPKVDLTIEEEKAKPAPKAAAAPAAPKAEAPKAAAPAAPKAEAPKAAPVAEAAPVAAAPAAPAMDPAVAAAALKAQAEAEAAAKAAAEAKAKTAADAKAKAEAEAAAKAAADALAAEFAKRDAEEAEIRARRAEEHEKLVASRVKSDITFTAAAEQKTIHDRMLDRLVSIHRKAS